jgi:hypothetical protein
MRDRQDSSDIRKLVQRLPASGFQMLYRRLSQRDRQRHQQHQRAKSGCDERTLDDVVEDSLHVEGLVQANAHADLQPRVRECQQPQLPTNAKSQLAWSCI